MDWLFTLFRMEKGGVEVLFARPNLLETGVCAARFLSWRTYCHVKRRSSLLGLAGSSE